MKKIASFISAMTLVAFTAGLTSCDSKAKLARDIEGTWASTAPKKVKVINELDATEMSMIQFNAPVPGSESTDGVVNYAFVFTLTGAMPPSDAIVEPYSFTATTLASVSGTWKVVDDDEVALDFDPESFSAYVDPAGILLRDNILSGENAAEVDSVKPQLSAKIQAMLDTQVKDYLFSIKKIDDIHIIDKDEMNCEILDKECVFHRQVIKETMPE